MFIQWQCPDCGKLNSYEVRDSEKIRDYQNGYNVQLSGLLLPCCDGCKKYWHLSGFQGKIDVY